MLDALLSFEAAEAAELHASDRSGVSIRPWAGSARVKQITRPANKVEPEDVGRECEVAVL